MKRGRRKKTKMVSGSGKGYWETGQPIIKEMLQGERKNGREP